MNGQQTTVMLIDLQLFYFLLLFRKTSNEKLIAENLLFRLRLTVKLRQDFLTDIYYANCRST